MRLADGLYRYCKGVLAMSVALIFSSTGGQLDQGNAHLQDQGYADISTKRAVIAEGERAAFGLVKVVSSSSAMEDVQPGCS